MSDFQDIKYSLGADKEKRHIFSALCLSFIIFIYFFVIGSSLPIRIYTFQNRVTYENIFAAHIINNNVEICIILVCMIIWLFLSINSLRGKIIMITVFLTFLVLLLLKVSIRCTTGRSIHASSFNFSYCYRQIQKQVSA